MKETKNTKLARTKLAALTDKPIKIVSLAEIAEQQGRPEIAGYNGLSIETDSEIIIGLNYKKPETHENTFVHEVLHAILDYEKYPRVDIDKSALNKMTEDQIKAVNILRDRFSSIIQHPEIYRRMNEEFDLNMNAYFNELLSQKETRFASTSEKNQKITPFNSQQNILEAIEYDHYNETQKSMVFKLLKSADPFASQCSSALNKRLRKNGMSTPEKCIEAGKYIKDYLVKFGNKRKQKPFLTEMFRALKIVS